MPSRQSCCTNKQHITKKKSGFQETFPILWLFGQRCRCAACGRRSCLCLPPLALHLLSESPQSPFHELISASLFVRQVNIKPVYGGSIWERWELGGHWRSEVGRWLFQDTEYIVQSWAICRRTERVPGTESEIASRRAAFRHFFFSLDLLFPLCTHVNKALVLVNTCLGLQQRPSKQNSLSFKIETQWFFFFF